MGEIGIPRHEYLYELTFWEMRRIIRGYRKREQTTWEQTRWAVFWLMHNGMTDLRKAGINSPSDLIQFPWDNDHPEQDDDEPTLEEVEELRRQLQEENRKNGKA